MHILDFLPPPPQHGTSALHFYREKGSGLFALDNSCCTPTKHTTSNMSGDMSKARQNVHCQGRRGDFAILKSSSLVSVNTHVHCQSKTAVCQGVKVTVPSDIFVPEANNRIRSQTETRPREAREGGSPTLVSVCECSLR